MALIKAGVWHTTVWASSLWQEDLWLEYGVAVAPTARGLSSTASLVYRRKVDVELYRLFMEYLTLKQGLEE
jgi:hypothetical protein